MSFGGGALVFYVHPRKKHSRIRVAFRSWQYVGVQKSAKLKKGYVFGHFDKFWKGNGGQNKQISCKNTCLGSGF